MQFTPLEKLLEVFNKWDNIYNFFRMNNTIGQEFTHVYLYIKIHMYNIKIYKHTCSRWCRFQE
jgi:hypothetical protein